MQTTITGRDATFTTRDVAIADWDAHRAFADDLVAQVYRVLESQERTVHMATSLLDRIDTAKNRLKTGPQTPDVISAILSSSLV